MARKGRLASMLVVDPLAQAFMSLPWVMGLVLGRLIPYEALGPVQIINISIEWPVRITVFLVGIALFWTLAGWQVSRAQRSKIGQLDQEIRHRDRQLHELSIGELLRRLVNIVSTEGLRTRGSIFLPSHDEELHIAYSCNMEGAPDRNLVFERNQGCSGDAWANGEVIFTDLREVPQDDLRRKWKMKPDQIKLTEDLGSILSIPLFDPHNESRVIGVLSLDSTGTLEQSRLNREELIYDCQQSATAVAAMISLAGLSSESGGIA